MTDEENTDWLKESLKHGFANAKARKPYWEK